MRRVPGQVSRSTRRAKPDATSPRLATTLAVDDLRLEVRRSSRRRTLGLTVDRGGELVLSAPEELDDRTLRAFVREKKFWIYTKLAQKEALRPAGSPKEIVNGEGFLYLGRSYRLLLVGGQDRPLKLEGGRFRLDRAEVRHGRDHLVRWYTEHATAWLHRRVEQWTLLLGLEATTVKVLNLGNRWGSCGESGALNFHWKSILLPPSVVDYVVVHELAHLREPNHTPAFWTRVERALPDYEQRKRWLAEHGAVYSSGNLAGHIAATDRSRAGQSD